MAKKQLTIDDLLKALKDPNSYIEERTEGKLGNTTDTWYRIGSKDKSLAIDIGIEDTELNAWLKDWIKDNPYHNI